MKLLYFDIKGPIAHFRRFYSNVTSLTYLFPPRNTLMGILGAIEGLPKDSYYELFSKDNLGLSVSVMGELRKLMVALDYLDLSQGLGEPALRGRTGMHPTKIELVVPAKGQQVCYRVFAGALKEDMVEVLKDIYSRIRESRPCYPVSLGPSFCLADIDAESVGLVDSEIVQGDGASPLPIGTVVPINRVNLTKLDFAGEAMLGKRIILEERLPPDFGKGRTAMGEANNFIFEAGGGTLELPLRGSLFKAQIGGSAFFGVFM